MLNIKSFYNS